MEIVMRKADDLKPYENNPRFNDGAVKYVAASIKDFGFKVPVVIDSNGIIVAGHTRVKAAQELGIEEVPCIVADDLTDEQIKAFRLADNKVSEFAKWDMEALTAELEELDMDMAAFGFIEPTDIDIDSFFEDVAEQKEKEEKEKEPERIQCPHCGEWFKVE